MEASINSSAILSAQEPYPKGIGTALQIVRKHRLVRRTFDVFSDFIPTGEFFELNGYV
ncbi:hypothetical protein HG549_13145 [Pseudomonas sp. SK]|uniref:hypothetical protein n=1 Tax=Pseudomonas sp. SK TaxID=2729423 RepID=UPI0014647F9E|nr:hypothetical protein [Pseudomonas sp. SK]QJQ20826.1 hypothetical protein HG549_13145 [Pseudomonas sp. SK]